MSGMSAMNGLFPSSGQRHYGGVPFAGGQRMNSTTRAAFAIAGIASLAAGCATPAPIAASPDSLPALQGQTLTIVTYDQKTNFMQMTAGAAAFAAIGAIAAASRSAELVKEYDLENPSIRVAEKLTPVLSEKLKSSNLNPVAHTSDRAISTAGLAALAGNKGLVFDIVGGSQSVYFPTDWSHYRVLYAGAGRLVDASTGKVVAQSPCKFDSGEEMNPPTYDELYANNAALLKSKLQTVADACVGQMTQALFGN